MNEPLVVALPRAPGRLPGQPRPMGVTPDAAGVNVAVWAPDAAQVEFCLFGSSGTTDVPDT